MSNTRHEQTAVGTRILDRFRSQHDFLYDLCGGRANHGRDLTRCSMYTGIVLTNDGNAILREIDVTHPAAKVPAPPHPICPRVVACRFTVN